MSALVHQCSDLGCPYFEQPSPKGCRCHKTDIEMLLAANRELTVALADAQGCFDAAEVEGLSVRILELEDRGPGSVPDLFDRRIRFAQERIAAALAKAGLQ